MAKVARAARNASLMRVESLDGTANKTIDSAESGEVYLLAGDPASERTITLPAAKAGAYVKFLVTSKADTAGWKIVVASGAMLGAVLAHDDTGGGDTNVESDGSDTFIQLKDDTHAGSCVELICDGTNWIATGTVIYKNNIPVFG